MTPKKSPAPSGSPAEGSAAIGRSVLLLGIAAFASVATMRVADPLLPQVAAEFAVTAGDAAIISSAFAIAYAIGQFVYGPLGDRFGKLRLIASMAIVSGLTVGAAGLASSLDALGVLRLLGGATAAAIVPLAMAFIGDHVPYERRQTMLARMISGTIFGTIFGQALGGIIGEYFGWRAVFPLLGAVFLTIGTLLLIELRKDRLPAPKLSASISVSALITGYRGLLGRPWALIVLLTVFLEGFFYFGAFAYIGADLHQRFSLDYGDVGLFLSIMGVGSLVYTLFVDRLVTTLGEGGLGRIGGVLLAIGAASLVIDALSITAVSLFLLGLGISMLHNTLQTNATQMAPETRGLAVSTFANCLFLGQAAGITVFGLLVDRQGFKPAYLLTAAGLLSLGLLFAALLSRKTDLQDPRRARS